MWGRGNRDVHPNLNKTACPGAASLKPWLQLVWPQGPRLCATALGQGWVWQKKTYWNLNSKNTFMRCCLSALSRDYLSSSLQQTQEVDTIMVHMNTDGETKAQSGQETFQGRSPSKTPERLNPLPSHLATSPLVTFHRPSLALAEMGTWVPHPCPTS